jgi:hypothetical protein
VATHSATTRSCAIFVGAAAPQTVGGINLTSEGEPKCN